MMLKDLEKEKKHIKVDPVLDDVESVGKGKKYIKVDPF